MVRFFYCLLLFILQQKILRSTRPRNGLNGVQSFVARELTFPARLSLCANSSLLTSDSS